MFVSGNITVLSVVLRLYTECRSVILETIRHEAQRAHLHRTEYTTYLKLEVLRIAALPCGASGEKECDWVLIRWW